jgi:hypothetical protein
MFTVLTNTRNSKLYIIVALATALVVLLTFAVAPSIAAPKPVIIPETGSQNAYIEFLRGEKVMYANPVGLSEALSVYRAGEKVVYMNAVDLGNALSAWRSGEKALYAIPDLSWPPRPDFSYLRKKNVAPSSYRSPTDECFDVPLREIAQCRNESATPSQ